jgi:hypothetical protein
MEERNILQMLRIAFWPPSPKPVATLPELSWLYG